MGCCGSKEEQAIETVEKGLDQTGQAAAFGGSVVAGAALGAAIAGPAAPIGAAVGGVVGAIIGKASAGTVGKLVSAPLGLLTDVWRGLLLRKEILEQLPDIGVLRGRGNRRSCRSFWNRLRYGAHGVVLVGAKYYI